MKPVPNRELVVSSLETSKKAIIFLAPTANFDTTAAALAFAQLLKEKNIDVTVVSQAEMRVEYSHLIGIDQVRKKVGNKNLVISFDYTEDQVEKVNYTISPDGKRFNLVISPKTGALPLQPDTLEFEFSGAEADFIAFFGMSSNAEVGDLYENERTLFDMAMTVAFNLFPIALFAKCHIDSSGYSGMSEYMIEVATQLGLELSADAATNILAGIDSLTDHLSNPGTRPEVFEAVATLLRAGAMRTSAEVAAPMSQNHFPFVPSSRPQPQPQQVPNNQFAQLLGSTQVAPPPSMMGEMKG